MGAIRLSDMSKEYALEFILRGLEGYTPTNRMWINRQLIERLTVIQTELVETTHKDQ